MYKYDAIKLNQSSLEDSIRMLNDYPPPWECFAIDNGIAYFRKLVYTSGFVSRKEIGLEDV